MRRSISLLMLATGASLLGCLASPTLHTKPGPPIIVGMNDLGGLVTDGQVTMTYGHEFRTGTVLDYTAVYIAARITKKFKAKIVFEKGQLAIIAEPVGPKRTCPTQRPFAAPSNV